MYNVFINNNKKYYVVSCNDTSMLNICVSERNSLPTSYYLDNRLGLKMH